MKPQPDNYNSIFKYTFVGAMLFVAALAFTLAYFSYIATFELSYTTFAVLLSASSISLLYKAARDDRHRPGEV